MNIIIVGAGKLGYSLADMFAIKDNNVTVIDNDSEALQRASAHIDMMAVHANGLNIDVLEQINIAITDVLIAVTEGDETNMLISLIAKRLGCKRVVARIRNPEYSSQLDFLKQTLGIDYIANPDLETAKEITKQLLTNEAIYMDDFAGGKVAMSEFTVATTSYLTGKCIKNINLPKRILIVSIKRNEEMLIPKGDTMLLAGDQLYLIGVKEELHNFAMMYNDHLIKPERKKIKRVMILGGGKTAYYLAKRLIQSGIQVKIVERNKERCKELAISLHDALVIHGDATDIAVLVEENVANMDAVVMVTGFDEIIFY
ncbi:MAG: Trk system potassium transporter TrkA [Firmicutes bacterium]|nr:Trk system potassium transporter TrkA [Bacillota bacterium]